MGFAADWLALREPADRAARDAGLLAQAAAHAGDAPVVLDLGCGTGSTMRAMQDAMPDGTRWRLLDGDQALLDRAKAHHGASAEYVKHDLTDIDDLPLDDVTLVTASALLDLVSAEWLSAFAARIDVPFYAALSYDGVMQWTPDDPKDAQITDAFNQHQQTDKGFGPALGPTATSRATEILEAAGFDTHTADSPWQLGPDMADLQKDLTHGIATAAEEAGMQDAAVWGDMRRTCAEHCHCVIGHTDLFAIPRVTQ